MALLSTHLLLSHPSGLGLYLLLGLIEYLLLSCIDSIRVVGLQPRPVDVLHVVLGVADGLVHLASGLEDVVGVQVRLSLHLVVLGAAADDVVGFAWYLVNVVLVPNPVRRVQNLVRVENSNFVTFPTRKTSSAARNWLETGLPYLQMLLRAFPEVLVTLLTVSGSKNSPRIEKSAVAFARPEIFSPRTEIGLAYLQMLLRVFPEVLVTLPTWS